ncbi:MAG: hypothetical protein ABIQ93_03705, partial [Saprospiraceae bacterium]
MSYRLSAVKYVLLGALLLTGAWNCRKDVDEFRPYVYGPSQASINQLLGQVSTTTAVHTFILKNLVQDTTLTTPSGVRIGLTDPEKLFADANNQPVATSTCQNLQIEITEVLGKAELLSRGIHTATYPDGQLLESGGIVFIKASCDGTPLQLLPNRNLKVQLPAAVPKDDMVAFYGAVQNTTDFLGWQATGDQAYLAEWIISGETLHGYELYPSQLGWVSAGRPLPEATSGFCVKLPTAMTDKTAQVFVVFKGLATIATLNYITASQSFCFD